METNRLTTRQRYTLVASALATLLVMGIAQCASLSVDNAQRTLLTLAAGGLSLLCVSVLLEDLLGHRLRGWWRDLAERLPLLTQ